MAERDGAVEQQVPLSTVAVLNILRTAAWLLDELEPVFSSFNTTAARFDVLDALTQIGRPARPVELKERLHVPAQTITGVLDALERAGLVRRTPNPTDRRSVLVEITPEGAQTIEDLCPPLIGVEEACMAHLSSKELEQLVGMLDVVQRTIRARHG